MLNQFSSVQLLSHVRIFETSWSAALQLPCPSQTPGVCSNSCPSSWGCHLTTTTSIIPFSFHLQSSPASRSFPRSQFFHQVTKVLKFQLQQEPFAVVQLISCVQLFVTASTQHARLPCPTPFPRACSNSCPLTWWCHPTISSSVIPFSFWLQSFPVSWSFLMSQIFTSGGQNIGISASVSVLPRNKQDGSPLGWTGWTSLQSKGLSRVFSNTTVQKHQFFGPQLSL